MENFVLYEELGKGDHSIIYKGRRKGTINFVAIHCIDKCKRPEVTNTVRMTHDIEHENVVRFHEWYETSNHLWLVVELCNGGSLETLIAQDCHLPESALRPFGIQLVVGLHYIHSLSILFHNLRPSKILLDTSGVLKYADFGLSKVEGENLEELFLKFAEAGDQWNVQSVEEMMHHNSTKGSVMYMAPELIQGAEPNVLTDLWALGCVLYEMFAGHPPFLAEKEEHIKERILTKDFPIPKVKGSRLSAKPSPEFLSLLQGLLNKDPSQRLDWPGLVNHSFWQGELSSLAKDFNTQGAASLAAGVAGGEGLDVHASRSSAVCTSSVFDHGGGSVLGRVKGLDLRRSVDRPNVNLDTVDGSRPGTAIGMGDYLRPKTAPGNESGGSLFTLSARPHTAVQQDDRMASPRRLHTPGPGPLTTREAIGYTTDGEASLQESGTETKRLIFHDSDFIITQIVDNPKIQKVAPCKYDPKTLPVPPFNVEKLNNLPEKDVQKQAKAMCDNVTVAEKGPPSQKRIQLLNYIVAVSSCRRLSTALTQLGLLGTLTKLIRESSHLDIRIKFARAVGMVAHFTEDIDKSINLSEAMSTLSELLRENMKNTRLKQNLLPALGELIALVAAQEQKLQESIEAWVVPSIAYTTIIRGIREGDDHVLNHIAAKIIETVTAMTTSHAQKFVTPEVCQSLWYLFKHSAVDSVRCTAISALCRITWQNPAMFQTLLDSGGLTPVMQALVGGVSRVQQAVITMLGMFMVTVGHTNRLFQDKDFRSKVMRCFESPSAVIRAKAFIVIYEMVHSSSELLLLCCQARLVMYIERDSRRQTPRSSKAKPVEAQEYLGQCLELLISGIVQKLPGVMDEILESLDQIGGRKHPSTVQCKQLRSALPLMPIFNHLVTSQVFRSYIVSQQFLSQYVKLLCHVVKIESGEINIESASAAISVRDFVGSAMSVLEGVSQHPALLIEFNMIVMEKILPQLAALVACQNVDTKAQALQLFGEIASVFLSQDQFGVMDTRVETSKLHTIIAEKLLPQFEPILLDLDPLPSYALKLMLALLEHDATFIRQMEQQGLIIVLFQVLMDHQSNPLGRVMQGVVAVIGCLVSHKETNMRELYDQGFIDHLTNLFFEVWNSVCVGEEGGQDVKTAVTMLLTLLDTLNAVLRYVSEVVRRALQVKNKGGDNAQKEAEFGEQLLMMNKSLTDLTSLLTQLLCYEDTEIQDLAIKCLSLLVQLFGGENKEALAPENMDCYSKALKSTEAKKQKVLLRVIKRLLTTDARHLETMKNQGMNLARTIQTLSNTASSHADIALTTVAAEILKMSGYN
ncbi:serine/threonine-protein kinase ulk4 [Plakobranchus ocellatus]|uniref:Serine/threonine-protein kinase ulk4 n=1 Tax=Plakobranchus ocellatus TaxID=259542 RepID=A0AAV4AE10_9GAST|nr:serine/threonine-protein kinase ulk4 [Plakobranchus ocellatus]